MILIKDNKDVELNQNDVQIISSEIRNTKTGLYNIATTYTKFYGKIFNNSSGIVIDSGIIENSCNDSLNNIVNGVIRYSIIKSNNVLNDSTNLLVINCSFDNTKHILSQSNKLTFNDCIFNNAELMCLKSTGINMYSCKIVGNSMFNLSTNIVINNSDIIGECLFLNAKDVTLYNCNITGDKFGDGLINGSFYNCVFTGKCLFNKARNIELYNCTIDNNEINTDHIIIK